MRIKEKEDALYVKGVVIPCGLSDVTGDEPQTKEDIKKIFTNYITHETDVQHSWVSNFGVHTLENTLTQVETTIAGQTVPKDSWIASMMIVNEDIKAMIREGKLNGFSLGAVDDKALNENVNFLNKSLRYEDLQDSENLNPLFISLVDKPANGFDWEVYDYKSFLAKSKDYGGFEMTEENNTNKENMVSEGFVQKLLDKVALMKAAPEENNTKEEKKEEEGLAKADEPVEVSNNEILDAINSLPDKIVQALSEFAKSCNDDELKKAEGEESKEEEKLDKSLEEANNDEELKVAKAEGEEEEEKKLEKSASGARPRNAMKKSTSKIPAETNYKKDTFLNSETRDMFGRNKKFL